VANRCWAEPEAGLGKDVRARRGAETNMGVALRSSFAALDHSLAGTAEREGVRNALVFPGQFTLNPTFYEKGSTVNSCFSFLFAFPVSPLLSTDFLFALFMSLCSMLCAGGHSIERFDAAISQLAS
jgi:hypothetical protein